jgi:DNA-binding transcriptional ArsR family regulator
MNPATARHGARMTDELYDRIADRFRTLGDPGRLRILDALRQGEIRVGELVDRTGLNQANLSKHLQLLHTQGFVERRKDGLFVHYRLANEDVFRLCDIMCGSLDAGVSAFRRDGRQPRPTRAAVALRSRPAAPARRGK